MQALRKDIERMASLDCTVTLRGEPGTGKELAARAIHAGSMRRHHRFLAVNCANFSSEQLAGQLFGYQSGDLSEAIRNRNGIFSSGQMGTLLFDKVEKMPLAHAGSAVKHSRHGRQSTVPGTSRNRYRYADFGGHRYRFGRTGR
jgi:DNA-binding NtrC family response regulator